MIEVLRNKNLTTRFQILVEIANAGPTIQQREIAKNLDITVKSADQRKIHKILIVPQNPVTLLAEAKDSR